MVVKLAPASWSAPALWRFGNDADIPERLSQPRRWQCFDKCSDLTNDLTDGPNDGRKRQRGCWLRSVTRSKAAEGRTHSKTLRAHDGRKTRASVLECASPLALCPPAPYIYMQSRLAPVADGDFRHCVPAPWFRSPVSGLGFPLSAFRILIWCPVFILRFVSNPETRPAETISSVTVTISNVIVTISNVIVSISNVIVSISNVIVSISSVIVTISSVIVSISNVIVSISNVTVTISNVTVTTRIETEPTGSGRHLTGRKPGLPEAVLETCHWPASPCIGVTLLVGLKLNGDEL